MPRPYFLSRAILDFIPNTLTIAAAHTEATICLNRHHNNPQTRDRTSHESIALLWEMRSTQTRMTWGNTIGYSNGLLL